METIVFIGIIVGLVVGPVALAITLRHIWQSKPKCKLSLDTGFPLALFTKEEEDVNEFFSIHLTLENLSIEKVYVKYCAFHHTVNGHHKGTSYIIGEQAIILPKDKGMLELYGGDLLEHKKDWGSLPSELGVEISRRKKPYIVPIENSMAVDICKNWALVPQGEKERLINGERLRWMT